MGAAAVVTVSMVPGYRSSSVRFSKDEGQAERALVRTGNSASSTGLNRSTAASIPAVGAPVLLECPRCLMGWMGEQARFEGPQTPDGASAARGAADEGDSGAR
jgi:hypothetical protein